jgi:hypothetical protein
MATSREVGEWQNPGFKKSNSKKKKIKILTAENKLFLSVASSLF